MAARTLFMGSFDRSASHAGRERRVHVVVLAFPKALASTVTAWVDVLDLANNLQAADHLSKARKSVFSTSIASVDGGLVELSGGVSVRTQPFHAMTPDVLLLPALAPHEPEDVTALVGQLQKEIAAVGTLVRSGGKVCAICTGNFLLAAADEHNKLRYAIARPFLDLFQASHPHKQVSNDQALVANGQGGLSGAGVASTYETALQLIADHSHHQLRAQVAALLIADPRRFSSTELTSITGKSHGARDTVGLATRCIASRIAQPMTVADLARVCGVAPHTLARRIKQSLGITPSELIQKSRVEHAKLLMQTTELSFEEIGERCGIRDTASFRTSFKTWAGTTPGSYRRRFGGAAKPAREPD
ncbi:MAG: helix-turn-helix domain-containing protein [Xanthomonadaceae bacterium]|nr:helix-turn-helix domain-containing protein [Xanthomonadaceae bacterium]